MKSTQNLIRTKVIELETPSNFSHKSFSVVLCIKKLSTEKLKTLALRVSDANKTIEGK